MKLNLFSILLLTGFFPVVVSVQPVTPTLYFIKQVLSWPNAESYCRATYTDLTPVKTSDDLQKTKDEAARQGMMWPLWIGLYNAVNSWRWSFQDLKLSATTFQNWISGAPDNLNGNEECVQINSGGFWDDKSCSTMKPIICYNDKFPSSSRFVGIKTLMNWTDAQTYCRRFHKDLATAIDATDNSIIQQVASTQGDSWFGLYRDGWTWSDHNKVLNIPWAPGQPDNYYGTETCGELWNGLFYDNSCSSGHYFVCYYVPPIVRQILKLRVTSDQNGFDPAVQESLLMQMVQKLQELGVSTNITVTWRLQPDGNVFYKK